MTYTMLGDRVLVRALPKNEVAERTAGGLWLPQGAAQDHQRLMQGTVEETGPYVSANVVCGMRVVCQRFGNTPVDTDGNLWVTREDDILCVLDV